VKIISARIELQPNRRTTSKGRFIFCVLLGKPRSLGSQPAENQERIGALRHHVQGTAKNPQHFETQSFIAMENYINCLQNQRVTV
jgi:hypothetical protein